MVSERDKLTKLRTLCFQGLSCLYLEAREEVAKDVNIKVKEYIYALEEKLKK